MNTQIKLYIKNGKLQLTVYRTIERSEKIHLNTSNQKLISKFINKLKSPITFSILMDNNIFKIQFKDESIMTIYPYSTLKDHAAIKSLIRKIEKSDNRLKRKRNLTRIAIVSLGMFLGLNHISKKVVYAKTETESKYANDSIDFEINIEKEFKEIIEITHEKMEEQKILEEMEIINELSEVQIDPIDTETVPSNELEIENTIEESQTNTTEQIEEKKEQTDIDEEQIKEEPQKIDQNYIKSNPKSQIPDINEIIEIENDESEEEILNLPVNELEVSEEEEEITFSYQNIIPEFGQNTDEKLAFVHENYGEIIENYALMSGIDQHLLECIYAQERGVHSETLDPLGTIGIAQLLYNDHVNKSKTLYNTLTGESETFIATDEFIKSLEGNIKTSVALLQYLLNYYDGNTMIALQAYNYGNGAMDEVLKITEERTGISRDEMIQDPSCLIWLEDVKSYKDGGYGEPNYIEKVFSRYNEAEFTAIYSLENPVIINLEQKTLKKSR